LRYSSMVCVLVYLCFACLPAGISETSLTYLPQDVPAGDPGSLIKRFVDPMMEPTRKTNDVFLDSDKEHAESAPLVITPKTPVYIRNGNELVRRPLGNNFILINGRVFMNYQSPMDPEKIPGLNIRPVDDSTAIPWITRIVLKLDSATAWEKGQLTLKIGIPSIFLPDLNVTGVLVEGRKTPFRIHRSTANSPFEIKIALNPDDLGWAKNEPAASATVFIAGTVRVNEYEADRERHFPNLSEMTIPSDALVLSRLIPGRDYLQKSEKLQVEALARFVAGDEQNVMGIVRLVNSYVASSLRYYRNSMPRTPGQIISEGIGDCDDFARLMVALLRSLGIPCSTSLGAIYNFNNYGPHAWVEVGVMDKDGHLYWFLCDPTLASVAPDKDYFVRLRNRIYLYPFDFQVKILGIPVSYSSDVLLNWTDKNLNNKNTLQAWRSLIAKFCDDIETSMSAEISAFSGLSAGLAPRREFLFSPASDYILVERLPVEILNHFREPGDPDAAEGSGADKKIIEGHTQWQIRINADSDLLFVLGVQDEDFDLEGPEDQEFLVKVKDLYNQLQEELVSGRRLLHCLEMTYMRDHHTDLLQQVNIRVSRYLAEKHFDRILKILRNGDLILPEDNARLDEFYRICHGKNFYFLLEAGNRKTGEGPE
jgi:hypothetical protein